MQARYQNGCLKTITRKDGIERWQFRWRARNPNGSLRPCKKTIGPVLFDYTTHPLELAPGIQPGSLR